MGGKGNSAIAQSEKRPADLRARQQQLVRSGIDSWYLLYDSDTWFIGNTSKPLCFVIKLLCVLAFHWLCLEYCYLHVRYKW